MSGLAENNAFCRGIYADFGPAGQHLYKVFIKTGVMIAKLHNRRFAVRLVTELVINSNTGGSGEPLVNVDGDNVSLFLEMHPLLKIRQYTGPSRHSEITPAIAQGHTDIVQRIGCQVFHLQRHPHLRWKQKGAHM